MDTPTKLITYEDSLTMPENRFEEIVHGESRVMPPPIKRHAELIRKLARILEKRLDDDRYEVLREGSGLGIERVPLTYRIPDLMVFQAETLYRDLAETAKNDPYIWATPELIVECLSPSNRKGSIRELLADYAQIAAPEVWLLDPKKKECACYRYESGAMRAYPAVSHGVIAPLLLPNASVDLEALWTAFHGQMK
ncbi:MAG: Uma2 family endonuclease [Bryobacteraceae bacterium]